MYLDASTEKRLPGNGKVSKWQGFKVMSGPTDEVKFNSLEFSGVILRRRILAPEDLCSLLAALSL